MKNLALLPASPEIREWCSILEQEMMHWPGVKKSHVFGTRAFYHRKVMFAMLPDWQTFELNDRNLIKTALTSLEKAYKDSMLRSSVDTPSRTRHTLASASH